MMHWNLTAGRLNVYYGYRRRPHPRLRKKFAIQRREWSDGERTLSVWVFGKRFFHVGWR